MAPALSAAVVEALRGAARSNPVSVPVRGGSMSPRLVDGDRVAVRPAALLWPGDVVVFRGAGEAFVVHRVLGPYRRGGAWFLLTQGDAVATPDDGVPFERVVGRAEVPVGVRERLRSLGRYVARAAQRFRSRGR